MDPSGPALEYDRLRNLCTLQETGWLSIAWFILAATGERFCAKNVLGSSGLNDGKNG